MWRLHDTCDEYLSVKIIRVDCNVYVFFFPFGNIKYRSKRSQKKYGDVMKTEYLHLPIMCPGEINLVNKIRTTLLKISL